MTVSFFGATDENDEGSTVDWGVNKNQTFLSHSFCVSGVLNSYYTIESQLQCT